MDETLIHSVEGSLPKLASNKEISPHKCFSDFKSKRLLNLEQQRLCDNLGLMKHTTAEELRKWNMDKWNTLAKHCNLSNLQLDGLITEVHGRNPRPYSPNSFRICNGAITTFPRPYLNEFFNKIASFPLEIILYTHGTRGYHC